MRLSKLLVAAMPLVLVACSQPAAEASAAPPVATAEAPTAQAATTADVTATADPALDAWIQQHMGEAEPVTYIARTIGAGADRTVVVYLWDQGYCGNAGCTMLILMADGASYRLIGETTVVQTPIRLLTTSTNGRPDIAVDVQGSDAEGLLSYDGSRYPSNASLAPAVPADAAGQVLIGDDDLHPFD